MLRCLGDRFQHSWFNPNPPEAFWLETIINPPKFSGTVANTKHPWLGYTQSRVQQKQPVEFDGFGTRGYMLYSLGYEYWIQQKQPVEFDGFGTHGYMLYSLGYEYWIQQKQPVEFDGFGTHGYMLYSLGYEYWIQQKQPVEFDGFGTHGYMLYSLGYTVEYRPEYI